MEKISAEVVHLGILHCLLAIVIYIFFENKRTECFRKSIWAGVWSKNNSPLFRKLNYVIRSIIAGK